MASAEDFVSRLPVLGSLFGAKSDEQEALERQFQAMADAYRRYGSMAMDARKQQMASQLGMFAPVQQYLKGMLPGIQPFDVQGALEGFRGVQMPPEPKPPPLPAVQPPGPVADRWGLPRPRLVRDENGSLKWESGIKPPGPPIDPSTIVRGPAYNAFMRQGFTPGSALLNIR